MSRLKDLTGKKFGRLKVLKQGAGTILNNKYKRTTWICVCDCNPTKEIEVRGDLLRNGKKKSCGCLAKESRGKNWRKNNTYDLSHEYGIGYTEEKQEFYFDLEDYDKIKNFYWGYDKDGYVVSHMGKSTKTLMHRVIMNCPDDKVVDHINHIKHDNRKSNLRVCAQVENRHNARTPISNKSSGRQGVTWNKYHNKWMAGIKINNKFHFLGYFEDIDDAIKAREKAEKEKYGEYVYDIKQDLAFNRRRFLFQS